MLVLKIENYRLRKIPVEIYEILRRSCSSLSEKQDENYQDCEVVVTNPDELPELLLEVGKLSVQKPLIFYDKGGGIDRRSIQDAFASRQVYLPDSSLLRIKDTKAMENACSDDLRRELQEGWKILAVCPQPGQRRPDYVLGRFDERMPF